MINTHYLELPLSRPYFHGSKGVLAIEYLLYIALLLAIVHSISQEPNGWSQIFPLDELQICYIFSFV